VKLNNKPQQGSIKRANVNTIDIYWARKKIAFKNFIGNFYIVKDLETNELFWEADQEQRYPSTRIGEFQIWIQQANSAPQISFVRPDWQLVIEGIVMERAFYTEVDIAEKTVELKHEDYRFVCSCS
jgi:hypothetical protein